VVIPFDYTLALVSGALLALSFPRYGHPAFAWIALVPLLVGCSWLERSSTRGSQSFSPRPRLRIRLFRRTLYWTGTVIRTFGGIPLPAAALVSVSWRCIRDFFRALRAALEPSDCARWSSRHFCSLPRRGSPRVLSRRRVWRVSVGAAWRQSGHGIARCSARECRGVYGVSGLVAVVNATIAYATLATGTTASRGNRGGSRRAGRDALWGRCASPTAR
jgi:apolipoprotein N-acyltransferase